MVKLLLLPFLLVLSPSAIYGRSSLDARRELERLLFVFDRDKDKKLTLDDKIPPTGTFQFKGNPAITAKGLYQLSNLAQELRYSELSGKPLVPELVFENSVDRISRSIRERYWEGLTRKIDASTIAAVVKDPKIPGKESYLYVPFGDEKTFQYYQKQRFKNIHVVKLPKIIPEGFVSSLGNKQGLLTLALVEGEGVPYVVPGGRFNEMYGWDSYFHVLGTLQDQKWALAKGMIDNFIYEITYYGKVLNANRTYYLTRSQPPFFTSMVMAYLKHQEAEKSWIEACLTAAIKEYKEIWMGKDRLTETGLSRYAGLDQGIPPEVEEGHFDYILGPYAKKYGISIRELVQRYNSGELKDETLTDFFNQDRAVRESGHDTTYRWRVGNEDRARDFVTVDLNSLLYKYELDLAFLISKYFGGKFGNHTSLEFKNAALRRKGLIKKFLWNSKENLFFDYNWRQKKQSRYISATTFYPMWASTDHPHELNLLTAEEARAFTKNALKHLEMKGGLAATALKSLNEAGDKKVDRQWEYPYGWPPHQILSWNALLNYELREDATRLIYKWLYVVTINARNYSGTIPEKFNVVTLSHKVFAEYGNVGTKFAYITLEGFGWMNASYQLGLAALPPEYLNHLKNLTPPEKVFSP